MSLVVLVLGVLLSGCGQDVRGESDGATAASDRTAAAEPTDPPTDPSTGGPSDEPTRDVGSCRVTDTLGSTVAEVDVDGDGRDDRVQQAQGDGCALLLVTTADGEVLEGGEVDPLPVTEAYAARLADGTRLLVTRAQHPRGGFQVRAYDLVERRLVELVDDAGAPLVPFVATDTAPATPVSVSCTDDGLRVTEAVRVGPTLEEASDLVAPQEEGWQLVETTYAVDDGRVEEVGNDGVPGIVPLGDLASARPDLVGHAVLEDCRA